MISRSESNRKAKDLLTHFNENMQKALFFQCKIASDASRRGPKRPKVCNCRQTHFWEKIKTKIEKVSLTTVTHFRPPRGGLLEKRVPGRAPRCSEKRGFQKWAFRLDETLRKYRFAIICIVLRRKSWWKKSRKKWNRTKHMCFTDQDAKVSILAERGAKKIEATKSQQQTTDPARSWFCVSVVTIGH